MKCYANQKLFKNIQCALEAFLTGFYEVVPLDALKFLDEVDLGKIISGQPTIDIDQLRVNARYNEYGPDSD